MKRVLIYARYSSDLQSSASTEDQVRLCREHAVKAGWSVAGIYSDEALSGGHLANRPGALALLGQVREGGIDLVLAEALDRLSRDQEDIAGIFKRLSHAGCRIVTLAEGEISELHIGLKGTMNALFLKDLAAKTRRGQRGRVEAGRIPGGNSYGYRMIRRLNDDGNVSTGEREIDPEQAAIVRRIFEDYVAGQPPRRIAAALNAEAVPSPRGGYWNASTINGSRQRRNGILNNELYLGRIVYNRQRFVKDPETGKRVSRLNPESEWVIHCVPHLRIIDDATWQQAQALKSRYGSRAANRRQTTKRLLSGLIRCGSCGGAMTIINRNRYSCSAHREQGTCDSPAGIQASLLEQRVMEGLKSILLGREDMVAAFAEAYRAELKRLEGGRSAERTRLARELARIESGITRCLDFITGGDGDPGSVRATLTDLEGHKRDLQRRLDERTIEAAITFHPNIPDLYRRKVNELQSLLENDASRVQATEIVRGLIERIEIHAGVRRGHPEVVLVGALASILGYASGGQAKTAVSFGDGGCRVLMVAGAGFEPATFRL